MITPVFEISQDETFVYITIKAPYSKVSEADILVEHDVFKFYAKPYFLRLHFPGNLSEDDRSSCVYDADLGEYKVKIAKQDTGCHFEDLDMLTKLLSPKNNGHVTKQPLIEVLNSDYISTFEPDEDFDWYFPQNNPSVETESVTRCKYGFANQKSGIFAKLQEDMHDVIQVENPERLTFEEREKERTDHENDKFDEEHYLADLFDDENVKETLEASPLWCQAGDENFTDEEKFILKELPNCEYLLDKSELQSVYMGLVDILFSYAYNWRCTQGDYSVESGWNIRTVSHTLSWCSRYSDLKTTLVSSYRRTLTYPLYRNWELAKLCQKDVACIMSCGKKFILKCLLDIFKLFRENDPYYLLNDLYMRDYCVWIQTAKAKTIESLATALNELKISKGDVGFDLDEIEEAARLVLEEEREMSESTKEEKSEVCTNDVISDLKKLKL